MKINRREAIKAALIGIPGLVLLPKALKAEESVVVPRLVHNSVTDSMSLVYRDSHIEGDVTLREWERLHNCSVTGNVLLAGDHSEVIDCKVGKDIIVHPDVRNVTIIGNIAQGSKGILERAILVL